MLSQLINELQTILSKCGDIPVATSGNHEGFQTSAVVTYVQPYYYDGGCIYPAKDTGGYHCDEWKSSKHNPKEFGSNYVVISSDCPELGEAEIVNGQVLPVVDWDVEDSILDEQLEYASKRYREARNNPK